MINVCLDVLEEDGLDEVALITLLEIRKQRKEEEANG